MSDDQFVHLHTHTEYSLLDGAAKIRPALEAAYAAGQPALGKSDHGNNFGDYEMWSEARKMADEDRQIAIILGVEAYMAPADRFHKAPVFWGGGNKPGKDANGESGDVSGSGKYTHMTLIAQNAQGLRALYEFGARASKDGTYGKHGRGDADLLADVLSNWAGATIIGTTGCPGGAVQTRIRLGQYDKALETAATFRDILGPENFFVELMDHGLDVEKLTRDDLLRLSRDLHLPLLATNDLHYVAPGDTKVHDALLCVQTGAQLSETNRFKFDGDQYFLKDAGQMRSIHDPQRRRAEVEFTDAVLHRHPEWQERVRQPSDNPLAELPGTEELLRLAEEVCGSETDQDYLTSAQQMRQAYATSEHWQTACDNTLAIAERIPYGTYDEIFLPREDLLPRFPVPEGHTEASYLRERVVANLQRKYPDPDGPEGMTQEAWDRAPGYELPVIEKMGYPGYILTTADFTDWARSQRIRVGPGRGSAAGSLVCYAMNITSVPTLENELLFERFINPERVSPPDVDIDFEQGRRDEVIRYAQQRWGVDQVCRIQTVGRMLAKEAIKDAARVLGMPFGVGAKMTAAYPKAISGFGAPLACVTDPEHPRYADAEDFRQVLASTEGAQEVFDLAVKMEGALRKLGVHACGTVVSGQRLLGLIPMTWSAKDEIWISGFPNAEALEPMGLLKMDFLGLDNMDVIQHTVGGIAERYGVDVEPYLTALDDPAAYAELASGHTVGMFQVASGGLAKLLAQMRADRFEDISAALALYRPGPMGAEAHTAYALRKTGREKVTPIHPELEVPLQEILGPTHGTIVYQEQVMAAARQVAGYSLARADLLRKAMGKKKPEVLAKEYVPFREGMAAQGFSEEATRALWDILVPFSAYAFNRCTSGDTVITRLGRGSHDWEQTVENVANRLHGRLDFDGSGCRFCYNEAGRQVRYGYCTACKSWRDKFRKQGGMNAAGRVGDRILPVKIVDVFRQGVKPLWRMTLADGKTLTSTANHRHLTPHGWRRLDELAVGDEVCTMAAGEWNETTPRTDTGGHQNWIRAHGYYVAERAHGKNGPFLHGRHADLRRKTALLERICAHCGETEGRLERAHLDGDPMNNADENLAYLCNSCHKKHDYANGGRTKMWRKGRAITTSPVVNIEHVGEQMTYDVTVDSEDHSWVANEGIVTHNSHTVSYGFITYATAWLKAHYPADYMAALLTQAGDDPDKKAMYLAECRRMGLTVLVPDVNDSGPSFTPISKTEIRFGLNAVNGLGAKAVPGIISGRESGPYASFADFLERIPLSTCSKGAVAALIRGGAFDSLGHTRRSLLECYEHGVGANADAKKAEAYGQFDLFSATEEVDLVTVVVPDVPEWDADVKLQLEREALGLYVSGHPLEGDEPVLAGNRTMTIGEFLAAIAVDEEGNQVDESVTGAVLAGQLVSAERKVARASLKQYAKLVLADLDSQIEIMAFGRAFQHYQHKLIPDSKVRVKVSLWQRDEGEQATVCVDLIDDLDPNLLGASTSADSGPRPVRVSAEPDKFTPEIARQIRQIALDHPGERPLHFKIGSQDWAPEGWLVTPDVEFLTEMKELVGPAGVKL